MSFFDIFSQKLMDGRIFEIFLKNLQSIVTSNRNEKILHSTCKMCWSDVMTVVDDILMKCFSSVEKFYFDAKSA